MADGNPAETDEQRRQNRLNLLVDQQARIDASFESVAQRLQRLAQRDEVLAYGQDQLTTDVTALIAGVDLFRNEVRDAIANLIKTSEVAERMRERIIRPPSDPEKQ